MTYNIALGVMFLRRVGGAGGVIDPFAGQGKRQVFVLSDYIVSDYILSDYIVSKSHPYYPLSVYVLPPLPPIYQLYITYYLLY
jgi:hypothetical protein